MSVSAARMRVLAARTMLSALTAGIVLGACGGGTTVATGQNDPPPTEPRTTTSTTGDAITAPTSTPTSVGTSPPSTAKTTTTRRAAGGPLAGRDAPVGSAGDQVSFAQGAGDPPACADIEPSTPPRVAPDVNYGEPGSIASHLILCFPGFTNTSPVDAVITSPTGRTTRRSVVTFEGEVPYTTWLPRPGDALGRYSIAASQGGSRASGAFTVRAAPGRQAIVHGSDARSTTPRTAAAYVYAPTERVGAPLDIVLAGFGSNQQVRMKFYRLRDGEGELIGDHRASATTSVGPSGEKIYVLDTSGAQRGTYMVKTEPQLQQMVFPLFVLS